VTRTSVARRGCWSVAAAAVVLRCGVALAGGPAVDDKSARAATTAPVVRVGRVASGRSAAVAAAVAIDLPKTPAQLTLDPSWVAEPPPELPEVLRQPGLIQLVARYRERAATPARGAPLVLSIVRFDGPNAPAWRPSSRAAYLDDIEASIAAACPSGQEAAAPTTCRGYRRIKRVRFETQGVPAMELQATNAQKATLLFRFLFFRTYTILATVELAPGSGSAPLRRARRALATFVPQPDWRR
jgi:hypothetical protein